MEQEELQRAIEAILFAAGERIEISRLSAVLEVDPKDVEQAVDALADEMAFNRRGIRILKLEKGYQMVYLYAGSDSRQPARQGSYGG